VLDVAAWQALQTRVTEQLAATSRRNKTPVLATLTSAQAELEALQADLKTAQKALKIRHKDLLRALDVAEKTLRARFAAVWQAAPLSTTLKTLREAKKQLQAADPAKDDETTLHDEAVAAFKQALYFTAQGHWLLSRFPQANHQYLGVNRVIDKLRSGDADVASGKLGVFWHTQGSGKSYSMVFLCQKVRRKVSSSYTFVLMTDRQELDKQIHGTFVNCGAVVNVRARARDGKGLQKLLTEDNSYVFSLIHKFTQRVRAPWSERRDVIVISDEAHRTQYGRLATNMRTALPNAKFIGFTGTPLMKDAEDQLTRRVFGSYVSTYDFQRAVSDGATVPLSYEPHGEKLKIVDDTINQRIKDRIDTLAAEGELSEEQEEKLYKELNTEGFVLTLPSRLQKVADDFARHFSDRWKMMNGRSKAMLVCLDKRTCVQMHDLIAVAWKKRADDLHSQTLAAMSRYAAQGKEPDVFVLDDLRKVAWMLDTEMCVVLSQSATERQDFAAWGLDIKPHRDKMMQRELEDEFKKPENPFRVAIVCAMWLTGFDVKPLATLYLDKPMQGHTLMQAIARVNRRAPGKKNGLIIDYNGMLKSLRLALATSCSICVTGLHCRPRCGQIFLTICLRNCLKTPLDRTKSSIAHSGCLNIFTGAR
jgi:type I restriction enzyme R subunit